MKKISSLLVLLLLIISGCSSDVDTLDVTSNDSNLIINQENSKAPAIRVSVVGNQDFSLIARKLGNGNVSGHWRDTQQGVRVNVECIIEFESNYGPGLLITGTVPRGVSAGKEYFTLLYDETPYDAVTQRMPKGNNTCQDLLNYVNYFYPVPITSGQVKIN